MEESKASFGAPDAVARLANLAKMGQMTAVVGGTGGISGSGEAAAEGSGRRCRDPCRSGGEYRAEGPGKDGRGCRSRCAGQQHQACIFRPSRCVLVPPPPPTHTLHQIRATSLVRWLGTVRPIVLRPFLDPSPPSALGWGMHVGFVVFPRFCACNLPGSEESTYEEPARASALRIYFMWQSSLRIHLSTMLHSLSSSQIWKSTLVVSLPAKISRQL